MKGVGFASSFPELGLAYQQNYHHHPHQQQYEAIMADVFLVIGATLFLSRVARPLWRAPMLAVADRPITTNRCHGSGGLSSRGFTDLLYSFISSIAKAAVSGSSDGGDSLIVS